MTDYPPGTMVRARGREWVVLPGDDPEVLLLRPLGGTDDDATGLYLPLEGDDVAPASLRLPDPARVGDAASAALLRDAVRLGFRSAAGPLRCLGRIAVEPRPYQVVPLLLALRQEPVRLLIGDDLGVGKTIEAALIARELLDRGEIRRLCVLCPPHLCEQWREQLRTKFHLPAVEVRPGTINALERDLPLDRSIFEEYPVTVASIDFLKGDRRRARFVQTCPELVIVDEAHAAARAGGQAQQQRHSLLRDLVQADPGRHLLLLTATPHSGDEAAFASLIGLLDPTLEAPLLAGEHQRPGPVRERLAAHFVQRRRADLAGALKAHTIFPRREAREQPYRLSADYRRLLEAVRRYTRELVAGGADLSSFHRRVRWWAALALLRCVGSSPAAAAVALRTRAFRGEGLDLAEADRLGQDAVFDLVARDETLGDDSTPGADTAAEGEDVPERRRLLELARQAEALRGAADSKLALAARIVDELLADGFHPIVFCRYLATAAYVAEELAARLPKATVWAVTGDLPPEERAQRVADLAEQPLRVLVATDCLSEGLDLQGPFNAVVHYDLSWNPTRHEQREGRVDRYGQASPVVRTALVWGQDNPVDGAVLQVLLRKAEVIRTQLGVSVPVPLDTEAVLEAILEALVLRDAPAQQLSLAFDEEEARVNAVWEAAAEREQRSRAVFAQHGLRAEEVLPELEAAAAAVGSAADVERFVREACARLDVPLERVLPERARQQASLPGAAGAGDGLPALYRLPVSRLPRAVGQRAGLGEEEQDWRVAFDLPAPEGALYLTRTHPLVDALASYTLDLALEPPAGDGAAPPAARCGAMRSRAVGRRTLLLLARARFIMEAVRPGGAFPMLAEECFLAAGEGSPTDPTWLEAEQAEALARAEVAPPDLPTAQRRHWVTEALAAEPAWRRHLERLAAARGEALLAAHRRVRNAAGLRHVRYRLQSPPEVDVLGVYVLLPAGSAS